MTFTCKICGHTVADWRGSGEFNCPRCNSISQGRNRIAFFAAIFLAPIPASFLAGVACSGKENCWLILSLCISVILAIPTYLMLAPAGRPVQGSAPHLPTKDADFLDSV
jgi:hypothetical protein